MPSFPPPDEVHTTNVLLGSGLIFPGFPNIQRLENRVADEEASHTQDFTANKDREYN